MNRMTRIHFDLFAQTIDNILQQYQIAISISAPDGTNNILRAEKIRGTTHQQMQQAKFQGGQFNFDLIWVDYAAPCGIKPVLSCFYKVQPVNGHDPTSPHPSHDLGKENWWTDRFNNDLIHTCRIGIKNLCFMICW